ncbi:MAG: hypothetical protein CM15mP23_20420 [Cryomorphaceae bacterium]|nr:MAG: hypothetical protein CM15mP23_20420 [Cryomorphaceae bacterium]
MVHCSGGAQTKVLHFVEDVHVIKDNMFDVPRCLNLFKNNQEQIGKRCIRFSIWDTAWKYILMRNMPMIL